MYEHERREKYAAGEGNVLWPEMSTYGKDLDDCKAYLKGRALSYTLAEANGWYPSRATGDFVLRLVIPAKTFAPGHVYWQARAIHAAALRYTSPRGPRQNALIYVAADPLGSGQLVAPLSQAVLIVEGPMDALAAAECGYDSISLMGITPPLSTLDRVTELVAQRPSVVMLDSEPEATAQSIFISSFLNAYGFRSRNVTLANVKDLAAIKNVNQRKKFLADSFCWV